MPKTSAALLLVRQGLVEPELLLVHPGGPFYRNKDDGVWSIPKGEVDPGEDLLQAAIREFREETSFELGNREYVSIGVVRQKRKIVHAWTVLGDVDLTAFRSNTFTMEWPPRSGKMASFPEVDRAAFFTPDQARVKLFSAQVPLIDRALQALDFPGF